MVATPDISESCWREVVRSTNWASNVNGTLSLQATGVNGSESSYAKHQRSPQVSMPSEKPVSRGIMKFESRENELPVLLTEVHRSATRGLVGCTGNNAGGSIAKLR
jgi:hypothetical protein